ncbi:carbohydrate-binding protein [Aquimarina sp. RZ0]|uniref:carbohydrate-binding protein n=1 Tax=Aquimarina sp. RZ0 TaxID=2607730 RepID=UPI0011F0E3A5|nr:carbohydrate-binding protein [Aquimarina sp. RZ0]KAA1242980.1 carbohydrate-binding protein [Aquimarina sp. RZ0]
MKTQIYFKIVLIMLVIFSSTSISAQSELFIATNGNDNNPGTRDRPLATLTGARDKARSTGAKTIWVRGGNYSFDSSCDLDAKDSGLKISGYKDEKAIFDGAEYLKPTDFKKVNDGNTLNRLHERAKGKVFEIKINKNDIRDLLNQSTTQLSMDNIMIHASRFPNIGYAHINPGSIQNSSETVNTDGSDSQPKGAKFKLYENINSSKWIAEIRRNKKAEVTGYYSADWLSESSRIFSINGGQVHLMDGSRYGLKDRGRPNRLYVKHLLCEVDQPGEWYYDSIDKKLYLWPLSPINDTSNIGIWAGSELINITNARDIKIQKITIQHVSRGKRGGDATIDIRSSESCEIAGVTFRYIANIAVANIIDGKECGIKSCDIFDCEGGFRCYGGTVTQNEIIHGKNYVENCHYTHIYSKDFYGKIAAVKGAGNSFRNNLIHNTNGQPFSYSGVDHKIELNEAFNTGIEEGDGGVFYTGNSIWSFGTVLKHNFIHHNMSVPGLLGKGGFHCDDFDAGEKIKENVFYKGGWAAVKFNKSGGQTVQNNIFIKGFLGVRNNTYRQSFYDISIDLIENDPNNTGKPNYIGRMLQAIGKPGWQNGLNENNWYSKVSDYWKNRYPTMDILFKKYQNNKNMHAYESRYYDNLFNGNTKNKFGVFTPGTAERNNKDINLDIFQSPANLNFKFKNRPADFPDIPFQKIGLYKDSFRCAVPSKDQYRKTIKQHFENRPVHDDKARYNRNTVNSLIYYNSGKMVLDLLPCYNQGNPTNPPVTASEYRYDLGTSSSPVFNEYTRMTNTNKPGVYSWTKLNDLKIADRGNINGANNINRDFLFGEGINNTLIHNVKNGFWRVVVTWGDAKDPRDNMRVMAEGKTMQRDISTNAGQFKNSDFTIEVTDRKLNLDFIDDGGRNNRWSVTRIWLRKVNAPSPPPGGNSGLIIEAEDFTNTGGTFDDAFAGGSGLGVNRTATTINYVNNGDWAEYRVDVPETGSYSIEYLITTPSDGSQIQLSVDGTVVSTTNVPNTGSWDSFTSLTSNDRITLSAGLHTIRIVGSSDTTWQWNLDKIILSTGSSRDSGINDSKTSIVTIFPNPVNNLLNIKYDGEISKQTSINVYDKLGRTILSNTFKNQELSIQVESLSPGMYFIKIRNNNELISQQSFIKQ